jgi:hypothetical protein
MGTYVTFARQRLGSGNRSTRKEGVMDRLSPLDALFVDAEDQDPHTSMAIASIAVFEGPLLPMRSSWLS